MATPSESPFTVEPIAGGVRLVLPARSTQRLPGLALLPVLLSVFGALSTAGGAVALVLASGFAKAIAFPFVASGLMMVLAGLWLRGSNAEVAIDHDEVRIAERLGPLRIRRRRPRAEITRVSIRESGLRVNNRPVPGVGTVVLETTDGRPLAAGSIYRTETLQPFAQRIAEELGLATDGEPVAVESHVSPTELRGPVPATPPRGSKVTVEHNAAGLLMTVPATGFRGPSRVLLLLGIAFAAFPIVFIVFASRAEGTAPGSFLLVPGCLVLVGLALVLTAVVVARRRALVAVVQGSLLIRRMRPIFGEKKHEWSPGEVTDVRVVDSNTTVNDRRLQQLLIDAPHDRLKLWTGRDTPELEWIAAVLREGLGIRRGPVDPTPADTS